jgi:PST family polysaccharide transporter
MATVTSYTSQRTAHRVLSSASWLVFGRIARLAIGVGVSIWVARYLRPADFGLLSSAIALVSILGVIGRFGLNPIVVRDLVRQPESSAELLGTVFAVRAAGAVIGTIVMVSVGWGSFGWGGVGAWVYVLVGMCLLPQSFFEAIELWFQAQIQAKVPMLVDMAAFIATSLCRVGLLAAGASLIYFATIPLLTGLFSAVGLAWIIRSRTDRVLTWNPNWPLARRLLLENWPMMLSQIAGIIYLRIDQVMLAMMSGTSEAGVYAAAIRLSEVWYFVPSAICISIKPALTRMREKNRERYYQILQGLFSVMTALALAVAIPITFLAAPAIDFLYGAVYAAAAPVLVIHIWSALFEFWKRAQGEWLINEGYLKFGMFRSLLGAAINVVLNLILIPHYGSLGAAVATLVSCGLSTMPANFIFAPARTILRLQMRSLLLVGLVGMVKDVLRRTDNSRNA